MFRYPVTAGEVHYFLDCSVTKEEIDQTLIQLLTKKHLYFFDGFYTLENEPALVERRKKGNERAGQLLLVAYRIGALLYKFPFVKSLPSYTKY